MEQHSSSSQSYTVKTRSHKAELSDTAPNYTAIANPRHATVNRSQASSVQFTKTQRSRRASLEADIPDIKNVVEARGRSKKEMQELNERLAGYIEKTRYLQAQNKKLKDELAGLKARWGKETEKIRQMYDVELKQLRRLLDEAERVKGEKDAKLATLDAYNRDVREQLTDTTAQVESCNEKIDRLSHELADRDGEIALLRRRLGHLEEDKNRMKLQMNKMKEEMARLHSDLDSETAGRIAGQAENQTLREELEFLKRVHDQEMKELYVLIKKDEDESREFWKTELGQAIHEIQKEYDEKVDLVRMELEAIYMNKLRELAKGQSHGSSESSYFKEENKKIKDAMAELRKKIAELQARNDQLERMLDDMQRESEVERRRHAEEQDRLEKELSNTEADLRRVLNELQALLDAKISLELEIAAYKKLLDAEGVALDKIDSISRQSSFRSSEKPSVTMEQKVERRTEHEGSQQAVSSEITARTQFEKTYKGNVCIEECGQDGSYVQLRNVGSKLERLTNCRIRRIADKRKPIELQLPTISLQPGQQCRLWAAGEKPVNAAETDVETAVRRWEVGKVVQTVLLNEEMQERAMHTQRTVFSTGN